MTTAAHIPLTEYLQTNYRPDCDYIDGEVKERNVGLMPHSFTMAAIGTALTRYRPEYLMLLSVE